MIANLFGLRAREVVRLRAKDFDLDMGLLRVHKGKNGKPRTLRLNTEEKYELACKIRTHFDEDDLLVPMRSKSYSEAISNTLIELGINEYHIARTSNHSIRKKFIIEEEIFYEENGMTKEEAIKQVSLDSGHNRTNTTNDYLNSK